MYFTLKKSKITAWWVARQNSKLTFFNICSKEELPDDLVVVGFMKDSWPPELAMSENHVVKVTNEGVITAKGSFYPFEEAHALYVNFLVNANNDTNTIIAFNWELNKSKMTADIIRNGKIIKDATFDFDSYHSNINDVGYSNDLESEVVVAPFSRRGVCMTLYIPLEAKSEMLYHAEFAFEREKTEYINRVKHFINGG